MAPGPALDAEVRRADEDRWLASRFAPQNVRARLVALYAVNYEIARAAEIVREPALGDIRLQWWREALSTTQAGAPRSHPALAAYAAAHRETPFPAEFFERVIDARRRDLDSEPFKDWDALLDYVDATAGGVMRLALRACGASADEALVIHAARVWGCVGMARAAPFRIAQGRASLPPASDLLQRAKDAYAQLQRAARTETAAFPALGYVALAPRYLRALERGRTHVSLLTRQLALIAAAARGRF